MFKINLVFTFTLCCTIVGMQCALTADTSSAVQGGFAFETIMNKLQTLEDRSIRNEEPMVKRSCADVPSTGIYTIQPEKPFKEPMTVLCDQEYETGGWIVIQHRFNGSMNFFRNWKEYKNGFGNLEGEFWLGLDRIYQLTASQPHELVVLLEDFEGNKTFAKYDKFEIGDENQKYVVIKLGEFSGTAGDSFSGTKGMKFSTFDADNDAWDTHCAIALAGAWWYDNCGRRTGGRQTAQSVFVQWPQRLVESTTNKSNLNGQYLRGSTADFGAMGWETFRGQHYALKASKMMIRQRKA